MKIVLLVVWGLVFCAVRCQDFSDTKEDFHFTYHEQHNVLLTIHGDACYFSYVPFRLQGMMHNQPAKTALEVGIIQTIAGRDYDKIWPSSLDTMRDEYHDLLANFECYGKRIYTLQLFPTDAATTSIFTCDFENSTHSNCPLVNAHNMTWSVHAGKTDTEHTGPEHGDHTCGRDPQCSPGGHYAYMEATAMADGHKAHLSSEILNTEGLPHFCLRFYYHMYGRGMGTLNVYAVDPDTTTQLPPPVWTVSGNQGPQWHEAQVTLNVTGAFRLVFEGIKGRDAEHTDEGDTALDDIALLYGPCHLHPASGQIRLVDGQSPSEGRVEIYLEGRWTTLCGEGFHQQPGATVICNSLGYYGTGPIVEVRAFYGATSSPAILTEVKCTGEEKNILDCPHAEGHCAHTHNIGVVCQPLNDSLSGQVRLAGGRWGHEGRVEVLLYGRWGGVCAAEFDVNDAVVVCRMLGYNGTQPTVETGNYYGDGPGHVWVDKLHCDGTENSILECGRQGEQLHCDRYDTVGVNCQPSFDVKARLAGNTSTSWEGRVEVYVDGRWGTVCANKFSEEEAKVVCRMVGYESIHPDVKAHSFYGPSTNPVLLADVDCAGDETTILDCQHSVVGLVHDCASHRNDVGVICQTPHSK